MINGTLRCFLELLAWSRLQCPAWKLSDYFTDLAQPARPDLHKFDLKESFPTVWIFEWGFNNCCGERYHQMLRGARDSDPDQQPLHYH